MSLPRYLKRAILSKKLTWTNRKTLQTKKIRQTSTAAVENIQNFAN